MRPKTTRIMNENEYLIKIIITALEGYCKFQENKKDDEVVGIGIPDFKYLLNHSIRHYNSGNWHNSELAMKVWNDITDDDINKFRYEESIKLKGNWTSFDIPTYVGNGKSDLKNVKDIIPESSKSCSFNKIFITEHTIPVSMIINELVKVYKEYKDQREKLENAVKAILGAIHQTRMLKFEDRRIKSSRKRELDDNNIDYWKNIVDNYGTVGYTDAVRDIYLKMCEKYYGGDQLITKNGGKFDDYWEPARIEIAE